MDCLKAWLSWLGIVPQSEKWLVRLLVRAYAWVVSSVPTWGAYYRQVIGFLSHINVSSLSSPLYKNKQTNK